MQSHRDNDHTADKLRELLTEQDAPNLYEQLTKRAEELTSAAANEITAGKLNEDSIREWQHKDMRVSQMPDDPQGVLRISVGGNVGFGYCVFRGSREACRTLLRNALIAIDQC